MPRGQRWEGCQSPTRTADVAQRPAEPAAQACPLSTWLLVVRQTRYCGVRHALKKAARPQMGCDH